VYPIEESWLDEGGELMISILGQAEYCDSYLCLPFSEVKRIDPRLYRLFLRFVKLFTDHPSEGNTYLIFLHRGSGVLAWRALFVCTHFEHNGFGDLLRLAEFMILFAEWFGESPSSACVNVLNGNGEFMVLELFLKSSNVPRWAKRMIRGYRASPRAFRLVFA